MTAHSTLLGGSIASRRIHCPASFREQLKAPPGVSSVYAEEGTHRHNMMAQLLSDPDVAFDQWAKQTIDGREVTAADIDAVLDAEQALHELEQHHGGNFKIIGQELSVQFPGVPGAFGTLDLVMMSAEYLLLVDFKFGGGVQVSAEDDDGMPNAQLMFYAAGLLEQMAALDDRTLVLAIVQPTFEPMFTHTVVEPEQMIAFRGIVEAAIADALSSDPTRRRGEWCRFAPCKATCPLWIGPLLDLTAVGRPPVRDTRTLDQWGAYLADAKRLVDSAIMYKAQIDAALIDHLKAGHRAPGFALKPGRTTRKWLDDVEYVGKALRKLGLKPGEIWQRKLQTFQVVDAAAKRRRKTIPDKLRPKTESTELVLTSEDDPQRVNVQEQAALFSERLKALLK